MGVRILADPSSEVACYHVFSRVAGGEFLFGEAEKDQFRHLMDRLLAFSGLELLTWCVLGNHFHLLLRVPNGAEARAQMSEDELFLRMEGAFSGAFIRETKWRVGHARKLGNDALADKIIHGLKGQMFDLPKFMHMLKRRFSAWYNQRHERRGTLWESRYGSVLVENNETALRTMSCYIDLNPVRAGLVSDPKDYRWCGYSEALAGRDRSRHGIVQTVSTTGTVTWDEAQRVYRLWMFEQAEERIDTEGQVIRRGVTREEVEQVLAAGGRLSRAQLLQCRVRYFTRGVAIGGREFVDTVFDRNRDFFGANRQTGARPLRFGAWDGLCSLRNLRQAPVIPPPSSSSDSEPG